jgi:hypothetical protein
VKEVTMLDKPYRWVRSPIDGTSHRLADDEPTTIGTTKAVCGHTMPSSVRQEALAEPPTYSICEVCKPRNGPLTPLPPMFARRTTSTRSA